MSFDGFDLAAVTASLRELFFLPGDLILRLLVERAPGLAELLRLTPPAYGGLASLYLSIVVWLLALIIVGVTWSAIRHLDYVLTGWVKRSHAEALRRMRVARIRVVSWIGMLRKRREAQRELIDVEAVSLTVPEARVLRCYAGVKEFELLTERDVARTLSMSMQRVRSLQHKLVSLRLIERGFGTHENETGYRITRAGQIYILQAVR